MPWQVWTALLLYLLLCFHTLFSYSHLCLSGLLFLVRSVVWDRFDLPALLRFYGTAPQPWRMRAQADQAYLPGFAPDPVGQHAA